MRLWSLASVAAGVALCACAPQESHDTAIQTWRDLQVHVESHREGPDPSMQEMLVFVNRKGSVPAWDCRVDLRSADEDPWKQAIEDGRVAVFRRAARVDAQAHSVLQVRLRAEDDETVLRFALQP